MANNEKQLSVSFITESIDSRTGAITYLFEAMVPNYEWTSFDFGLSLSGEWVNGSRTFFDLDIKVRDQALANARTILSKMKKKQ